MDDYIEDASEKQGDNSVIVAVLDTGVDYTHSFLKDRIVYNSDNTIGGYDFIDNDSDPQDEYTVSYHGTHCSGIVADCTQGLNVKILAVRVLDEKGSGSDADVAAGINYAIEQGVNVINLSLGGLGCSKTIDNAINKAMDQGIVVCAAAGNESYDLDGVEECLAHNINAITVAAIDSSLNCVDYSNYGSVIDACAPGSAIKSCNGGKTNGYHTLSGTSTATPHVSALAAMLLLINPDLSAIQVSGCLKASCKDLGSTGRDDYFGTGLPQMDYFVNNASQDISIKVNESITFTDITGDYSKASLAGLDTNVASASLSATTIPGESETKSDILISNDRIVSGNSYTIGKDNYLLINADTISNTSDKNSATLFKLITVEGDDGSAVYLNVSGTDNYLNCDSNGNLSISTSADVYWYYSIENGLCYVDDNDNSNYLVYDGTNWTTTQSVKSASFLIYGDATTLRKSQLKQILLLQVYLQEQQLQKLE